MSLFNNNAGNENREHKGGRLKQAFEMAKPSLNLSADQEQKISEIFKNFREERRDLKSTGGDNMKEDMRLARQQLKQQLMEILNNDQQRVLEQTMQKWKDEAS